MNLTSTSLQQIVARQPKQTLTTQQGVILTTLMASPGLTAAALAKRLGTTENVIKVQISHMRKSLERLKIKIVTGYAVRGAK